MIESKDLELQTSLSIGTLTTNADLIQQAVKAELQNYKPEYFEDVAEAKKARADLNKAADRLNEKRLELEKEWNKPFDEFKKKMNETKNLIKEASNKLDDIVKAKEDEEKEAKRIEIENYFNTLNFTLCPLDKIFNTKWLNKSTKMSAIKEELNQTIQQILDDLEIIENFPKQDVPLIKAVYMNTLSLSEATKEAKRLQESAQKLEEEKRNRQQHAINVQVNEQRKEEMHEKREEEAESMADLAGQLMHGVEQKAPERIYSYALLFSGTKEKLLQIRELMSKLGVTYTKLIDNGDGSYII